MPKPGRHGARPLVRGLVVAAAGLLLGGLYAGTASAGTASVVVSLRGNTLRYVAGAGETNGVVITVSGGTYSVFDTAGVTAGS
ncbi:MAG: hypothetical protein HYU54_04190, partial [Actinobacteria bacterium]|nr:hypothetical protein [Actinomycetota bacterium]